MGYKLAKKEKEKERGRGRGGERERERKRFRSLMEGKFKRSRNFGYVTRLVSRELRLSYQHGFVIAKKNIKRKEELFDKEVSSPL